MHISVMNTMLINTAQVHIPLDPTTKTPKGLAYVTFADPTNAVAAYEALDKKSFQGRLLHILPAISRKGNVAVEEGKVRTVKEEKEAKKRAAAGKEFNWAMLYMNVCTLFRQYISFELTNMSCRVMQSCPPSRIA